GRRVFYWANRITSTDMTAADSDRQSVGANGDQLPGVPNSDQTTLARRALNPISRDPHNMAIHQALLPGSSGPLPSISEHRLTPESSWADMAGAFKRIKNESKPIRAEWIANEGNEAYGIWLLLPDGLEHAEARAWFSLVAACAIAKLGLAPIPLPEASQHDP